MALAACGAPPPQASVDQASLLSRALTSIAADCGESYRLEAFNPHPDLSGLEKSAGSSAAKLATLARHHPRLIYQGDTIARLAALSRRDLAQCSLTRAAGVLPG